MTEYQMIGLCVANMIAVIGVAGFYSLGGRSNKWVRRYIAPAALVGYCALVGYLIGRSTWAWAFASYPLYVGAYSIGYGETSKLKKWLRREGDVRFAAAILYVAASVGIVAGFGAVNFASVLILAWSVPICVFITTNHPFPAAVEEYLVGYTTTMFVPFVVFTVR